MKKAPIYISIITMMVGVLFYSNTRAQSGCHSLFSAHQTANTLTVNFSDSSTSGHTIVSWLWHFGDGTTSTQQNPHHTYNHDGTFHVCLTIHDNHGCSNTFCHHVTVTGNPSACHANFSFHADSTGNIIQFTNISTGTGANTTYSWDFGDGTTSSDENPDHTFPHPAHYLVCLFMDDSITGCQSHYCHTIYYHHSPHHSHAEAAPTSVEMRGATSEDPTESISFVSYPNPFSTSAVFEYELSLDAIVYYEVYDMLGNKILSSVNELESAGVQTHVVTADNLKSGLYVIRLSINGQTFMKRIEVNK